MALALSDLKAHCNITGSTDDAVLTRLLSASETHVVRLLGFALDDVEEFPEGTPADLELAVLQLAADWYENREASLVGVSAMPIPFGVQEVINEYRTYTFAHVEEVSDGE